MVPVRELLSALVSPVIVVFTLLIALKTFAIRPLQDQLTAMQLSLQHIDQQLVPCVSELQGRVDVLQQTGNTLLSK